MYSRSVEIINRTGLHARPASDFVQKAKQFQSKIKILNKAMPDSGPVNAKSIVSVLTQCLAQGTVAEISAEGPDEEQAVEALVELIQSGFGE